MTTLEGQMLESWLFARPLWFRVHSLVRIIWIFLLIIMSPLRKCWRCDPASVRVFILVRDLYSQLQGLVDSFLAQGVSKRNIYILNSGSSSPECLSVLAALEGYGVTVVELSNLEQRFGPYALWMSPRLRNFATSPSYPYIVTDSDLSLANIDVLNWLEELFSVLNSCRFVSKVSLPLLVADISVSARPSIIRHEQGLGRHPLYKTINSLLCRNSHSGYICPTDTTLSLYRPGLFYSTFSIRLSSSFSVRHMPWYSKYAESAEFTYYKSRKLATFGDWSS